MNAVRTLMPASLAFALAAPVLAGDPRLDYWIYNDGRTGICETDGDIWAAICNIPADVTQIRHSANFVYITSNSIPSHSIGPWGNPNIPAELNQTFKIPKVPANYPAGAAHATIDVGTVGILTNGVSIYNAWADPNLYPNLLVTFPTWHVDAMSERGEADTMDDAMGHPSGDQRYHHHCSPMGLRELLRDHGHCHSPLLGFARDGYPIYGPYAYSDPNDPDSAIVRMKSSYRLKTSRTAGGPPTLGAAGWPLGSFAEDYEYIYAVSAPVGGIPSDQLDRYNGRVGKTPEYSAGTFAYFITVDETDNPVYPYLLGPTYYGVPNGGLVSAVPGGLTEVTPSSRVPCPEICCHPASQTDSRLGSVTLEADVRYGENLRYYWWASGVGLLADGASASGSVISGAFTNELTISGVQGRDDRTYACIIMSDCTSLITNWAQIDVLVGDADADGDVDLDDFAEYIDLYTAGDLRADVDNGTATGTPNGGVTSQDLTYFFSRWAAGS